MRRPRKAVVIINETMARQFWGDDWRHKDIRSTSGSSLAATSCASSTRSEDRQIIGVIGDLRDGGLKNEPGPE